MTLETSCLSLPIQPNSTPLLPPLLTLPLLGVKNRGVFILILGVGEEVVRYGAERLRVPIHPLSIWVNVFRIQRT